MNQRPDTAATILRILCAVVFLSLGFAHKSPAAIATNVQSAAYSLPDGSFADLCIADQGRKHATGSTDCEACRLTAAIALPAPTGADWLITFFASLGNARGHDHIAAFPVLLGQPRSRGPPRIV